MRLPHAILSFFRSRDVNPESAIRCSVVDEMRTFLQKENELQDFARAEKRIRNHFGLYQRFPDHAQSHAKYLQELSLMATHGALAQAFIFHGDGRIRESALSAIDGPIAEPVVVYGLISRLNDWSAPVRAAAEKAFERWYFQTPTDVVAPAIWMLLVNAANWERWSDGFAKFVRSISRRSDLFEALLQRIETGQERSVGKIFRALCQSDRIDTYLQRLFFKAKSPFIRAYALRSLYAAQVVWPTGAKTRLWIDKSMGDFRTVAEYSSRPISIDVDLPEILTRAVNDPSTIIRKEALDALIQHRKDPRLRDLIATSLRGLVNETSPGIRSRLEFLEKQQFGKG